MQPNTAMAVDERIAYKFSMNEGAAWESVLHRDPSADGRFLYAVTTTGIYCRPSCPSRRPKRDNVAFFSSVEAAERAGFRACHAASKSREVVRAPRGAGTSDIDPTSRLGEERITIEVLEKSGTQPYYLSGNAKLLWLTRPIHCARKRAAQSGLTRGETERGDPGEGKGEQQRVRHRRRPVGMTRRLTAAAGRECTSNT